MSHSTPMSIDHSKSKRKLPLTRNINELAHEVDAQPIVHESKRYKLESAHEEQEEVHTCQTYSQDQTYFATKPTASNYIHVKIPNKAEIAEVLKREAYMKHMFSLLKREKANYLFQLKEYDKPFCGTISSTDLCDEPPLTNKKDT